MAAYKGAVNFVGEPKRVSAAHCAPEPRLDQPTAIIPAIASELDGAVRDLEETAIRLWKRLDSVILQEPSEDGAEPETPQTGVVHADRLKDIYQTVLSINRSLTRLISRIEC